MEQMHINFTHFKSEISLMDYFDTEDKCKAAIAQERWGEGEAVKHFDYCDVLSLSSVIDVKVWKEKHDSYYWLRKVA